MPAPSDLRAPSPVTHMHGWPFIFLVYEICNPGEGAEPLLSHLLSGSPGWSRALVWQGGRPERPRQASALQSAGGCLGRDVLLAVPSPSSSPSRATTFSPLPPESRCPLCVGGKLCCKALVGEEGDLYWQTSPVSVCHACRLPAPGALSLHLAGSRTRVPKRSGQESLPR